MTELHLWWRDMKSRMNREVHVRFWERAEVKLRIPGASRPPFRDDCAHHSEMISPTVPR